MKWYPLVTAVMVTGKTPHHEQLARKSAADFFRQTWPNRELLVINDGGYSLSGLGDGLREIRVDSGKTLGELRNIGLEAAKGEWIIQWDDDDRHHPDRIRQQMSLSHHGLPVTLRRQIRYHMQKRKALVHTRGGPFGIEGTVLHKRTDVRYPAQKRSEDSVFIRSLPRPRVIDNDARLYIRQFHGHNTWDERHVMNGRPWGGSVEDILNFWEKPPLLIITGTGRCGTSFLASLCRECGQNPSGSWDDSVNAGYEHPKVVKINEQVWKNGGAGRKLLSAIKNIDNRVVKDPRFVRFGHSILSAWAYARKDIRVLLVTRDLDAVVQSMLKDRRRFCAIPPLPSSPKAMKRALENQLSDFRRLAASLRVPILEIEFPWLLDHPTETYQALENFGALDIPYRMFFSAFQKLRDPSKVHF